MIYRNRINITMKQIRRSPIRWKTVETKGGTKDGWRGGTEAPPSFPKVARRRREQRIAR